MLIKYHWDYSQQKAVAEALFLIIWFFDNAIILHCNLHIANLIGSAAVAKISKKETHVRCLFASLEKLNWCQFSILFCHRWPWTPWETSTLPTTQRVWWAAKHSLKQSTSSLLWDSGLRQLSLRLHSSQTCGETPSKDCQATRIPGEQSISQSNPIQSKSRLTACKLSGTTMYKVKHAWKT